ncbi:rRNA maturation RNase YbeY [soil metagenome]
MPKRLTVEVIARRQPTWLKPFTVASLRIIYAKLLKSKLPAKQRRRLAAAHSVTVGFVTPDEIKRLNGEFRGKNQPTDVLSFAPVEPGSLGDLIITMPLIRTQAKENGHSVRCELTYILLHGTLHLLGLDHGRQMFSVQDEVFDQLREKWLA